MAPESHNFLTSAETKEDDHPNNTEKRALEQEEGIPHMI